MRQKVMAAQVAIRRQQDQDAARGRTTTISADFSNLEKTIEDGLKGEYRFLSSHSDAI